MCHAMVSSCTVDGSFQGDGSYTADGGAALQRLWSALPWREIRNCPGRYTTRDAGARTSSPPALLSRYVFSCNMVEADLVQLEVCLAGKDPIVLQRFPGGGGLLTYCKPDGMFIHTLNTESGMARKIDALGLALDSRIIDASAPWVERAALTSCVAILPFLEDKEKNASAYTLIRAFRRAACRLQKSYRSS
eukprot:gnl/TRDRNA2_/TRDRNA2_89118_c0_seq1.p1 gnl/TRDRNA2_/TRDRNA2_89118_c0~~gnl/TRDRNA2_/TRDRNA2_89118_c0_seq1.p1  ORF type:complete len:191 (+),score=27.71 gnl/TRDRNA2_/TRDRNA2_89118_c0_seq1:38-610(+)